MHCEQCRRPLKHAQEICQACNQELSYPTSSDSNKALSIGRYRCPACNGFFDRWATTLLPRNARWYMPQSEVTTCPLCEEALQWKRDTEPAQLPAGLQGIAMGMTLALYSTIPSPLLQGVKEHLGKWFAVLIPLLLFAMLFVTVRPPLLRTGQGVGQFVLTNPSPSSRRMSWAIAMSSTAILLSHWTASSEIWLHVWGTWVGLGVAGCLAAIVWRQTTERRMHKLAAESVTHPQSDLL